MFNAYQHGYEPNGARLNELVQEDIQLGARPTLAEKLAADKKDSMIG